MLQALSDAADRLRNDGKPVTVKLLTAETGYWSDSIYRKFARSPELASVIGCKIRYQRKKVVLDELKAAAIRLHAKGKIVNAKRLAAETGYSEFQIYKEFRKYPDLAPAIGCMLRMVVPMREFCKRICKAARVILQSNRPMDVPTLAEISGIDAKRIWVQFKRHPRFKRRLGVVPAPVGQAAPAYSRR